MKLLTKLFIGISLTGFAYAFATMMLLVLIAPTDANQWVAEDIALRNQMLMAIAVGLANALIAYIIEALRNQKGFGFIKDWL